MRDLAYPIKLDDAYPCRGTDARGEEIHFDDLLPVGTRVGPQDRDGNVFADGEVVRREDGLWIVPIDPDILKAESRALLAQLAASGEYGGDAT